VLVVKTSTIVRIGIGPTSEDDVITSFIVKHTITNAQLQTLFTDGGHEIAPGVPGYGYDLEWMAFRRHGEPFLVGPQLFVAFAGPSATFLTVAGAERVEMAHPARQSTSGLAGAPLKFGFAAANATVDGTHLGSDVTVIVQVSLIPQTSALIDAFVP